MTNSSVDKPSVGLFIDWNNTASPGGINEALLASKGGSFTKFKERFDADWNAGGWMRFAPQVPFREGKDVNTEKGALKRWARANALFELQRAGDPVAPAISIDEMYEFGRTVLPYEGFDSLMSEMKERVLKTTGKRLWITVVTNAWAPVIRGTKIVRSGIVDQVVGQEFVPYLADDGRVLAQPSGGVGEETKPLAVRFVSAQNRFQFMPGPIPDGSRLSPPSPHAVPTIKGYQIHAIANGFSDKYMIDHVAANDGVMTGVIASDYVTMTPRLFTDFEYRQKVRKYTSEDIIILQEKFDDDRLSETLRADYRTTTVDGRCTRASLLRSIELVAALDTPNLAHEIIRGRAEDPRSQSRGLTVADNFRVI